MGDQGEQSASDSGAFSAKPTAAPLSKLWWVIGGGFLLVALQMYMSWDKTTEAQVKTYQAGFFVPQLAFMLGLVGLKYSKKDSEKPEGLDGMLIVSTVLTVISGSVAYGRLYICEQAGLNCTW